MQHLPHCVLSCRAQNHLGKPQKVGVAPALLAAAQPRAGGGEVSELIRRSGLCSWGPRASWGPGCVWKARKCPACTAAAAQPLGPVFARAGARSCMGRQGWGWWLLDRSHLHAFCFVPWDGCEQRECMQSPTTGHLLILRLSFQPGVPGLDALQRGDLAGRAARAVDVRVSLRGSAGKNGSSFPTWLPAVLPGPGLPLACCLTCEPVSVCFVSLRTHSPALSPRNITSLPAPPSTKQLGPLGPAHLRTHGLGW